MCFVSISYILLHPEAEISFDFFGMGVGTGFGLGLSGLLFLVLAVESYMLFG
ncbi:MAG: hypothetical protein ACFB16_07780 [Phormidesmis sp.]